MKPKKKLIEAAQKDGSMARLNQHYLPHTFCCVKRMA